VCPDHTTTLESSPTDTSIEPSHDHPRSWTSLSWPISRRKILQFSTEGASLEPEPWATDQYILPPSLLAPCSHTKGGGVRRLIWIQHVDTNDLVICPRRDITPVRRKSNSMNRARMVAHRGQLLRFRVGRVCRIINCIDRPYPYISI
jgi:hypothetical protein